MTAAPFPLVSAAPGIAGALAERGYASLPRALPVPLVDALREELQALPEAGLTRAGIGRGDEHRLRRDVRRDRTRWLNGVSAPQHELFNALEALRLVLNRELFLGLFDLEAHYAWYPPGAYYARHYDAFAGGGSDRVLSCVFYLNDDWPPQAGGELVLYTGDEDHRGWRWLPAGGSAVLFLSERFPHEVLPALRDRYSIAAWFRINNSRSHRVDPPR